LNQSIVRPLIQISRRIMRKAEFFLQPVCHTARWNGKFPVKANPCSG
jgi:hypothetical protein